MENLTKEQKYTIAKFYKLYMERSNAGQPEEEANHFKAVSYTHLRAHET